MLAPVSFTRSWTDLIFFLLGWRSNVTRRHPRVFPWQHLFIRCLLLVRWLLAHPREYVNTRLQCLRCLRAARPQYDDSGSHERRVPRQLWILPSLHGPPVLHIPDLRAKNQHCLRHHLSRPVPYLCGSDWILLAPCSGPHPNGGEAADSKALDNRPNWVFRS